MIDLSMQYLWVEKYRPCSIDDIILPTRLRETLSAIDEIPHLLMFGDSGIGKTTVARALCKSKNIDYLFINASENGNIDTLRTTIRSFASTMSLISDYKVVIMDECDNLTSATMNALRGFLEEFSHNCRFIFTCNHVNKVIPAIRSRCTNVSFKLTADELQEILPQLRQRIHHIINIEGIKLTEIDLTQLILMYFPDIRRIINELQINVKNTNHGKDNAENVAEIFEYLKDLRQWNKMREWVSAYVSGDYTTLYTGLYKEAHNYMKASSIPQLVLILADYQYKANFVADAEINLVACLTEIMTSCEFKS